MKKVIIFFSGFFVGAIAGAGALALYCFEKTKHTNSSEDISSEEFIEMNEKDILSDKGDKQSMTDDGQCEFTDILKEETVTDDEFEISFDEYSNMVCATEEYDELYFTMLTDGVILDDMDRVVNREECEKMFEKDILDRFMSNDQDVIFIFNTEKQCIYQIGKSGLSLEQFFEQFPMKKEFADNQEENK